MALQTLETGNYNTGCTSGLFDRAYDRFFKIFAPMNLSFTPDQPLKSPTTSLVDRFSMNTSAPPAKDQKAAQPTHTDLGRAGGQTLLGFDTTQIGSNKANCISRYGLEALGCPYLGLTTEAAIGIPTIARRCGTCHIIGPAKIIFQEEA
ncbi:hypothetical protein MUP32_02340 [Candidatus Microgenomates bacterium]|nr:hypothetical protein [Candidatus Microgenomates bacterium]